jgi:hypothetical protein
MRHLAAPNLPKVEHLPGLAAAKMMKTPSGSQKATLPSPRNEGE